MKWSDKIVFITDAQSGFKLGVANVYNTIFALQSIIDKHLSNIQKYSKTILLGFFLTI